MLKRQLFTKRTQASAYNEVKDNLKQTNLLIHVDYSENYNNKQQWGIQKAYFGHASFSILAACCYFKDESNAINKEAITVTSETSDHSRSASVSCLQKVIHFVREKYTHLPLKLNVIVWSDGCAAQFRSRYVFLLLSKSEASINLNWFYNERHHGKGHMDGIRGTLKNAVYRDVKSGKAIINDAREFAEYVDKTIKGISFLYMCPVNMLLLNRRKSRPLQRFQKPLKSISLCAPWRKEKILRFTSIT